MAPRFFHGEDPRFPTGYMGKSSLKMPIFVKAGSVFFSGPTMSEDSNFGGHGTLFGSAVVVSNLC